MALREVSYVIHIASTPDGVWQALTSATSPSGTGVENCWSAWLSSERRVWVGRRPAILASIGSAAAGEPDVRRSAAA
jgi:hypothetical protein